MNQNLVQYNIYNLSLINQVADQLNDVIDSCFPAGDYPKLKLIGKVGSFYAKSAFTAVTNVIGKKQVVASDFDAYENQGKLLVNFLEFLYIHL